MEKLWLYQLKHFHYTLANDQYKKKKPEYEGLPAKGSDPLSDYNMNDLILCLVMPKCSCFSGPDLCILL
jgi:hypothetical protein